MRQRIPAVPPGEFLKEELEERGWMQVDLSDITGLTQRQVNEIITAKRAITPRTARILAEALGTSADLWMNLESSYQLSQVVTGDTPIAHRAKLYQKAPVREMIKRHWIEYSADFSTLESRVLNLLGIKTIDDDLIFFPHAPRAACMTLTPSHYAWLSRAKKLALAAPAERFTEHGLGERFERLRPLLRAPQDARHVARILSDLGIRFVVLEPLRGTRIDGACFWLDKIPVVVLSLRYDRIDYFWFTLLHELAHVKSRDGSTIDIDLVGDHYEPFEHKIETEKRADRFASEFLVRNPEMNDFIARKRPLYSKEVIRNFANRVQVHPGIVVGQLQFRKEVGYYHSREMLEKVRKYVVSSALTDGWGYNPPADL